MQGTPFQSGLFCIAECRWDGHLEEAAIVSLYATQTIQSALTGQRNTKGHTCPVLSRTVPGILGLVLISRYPEMIMGYLMLPSRDTRTYPFVSQDFHTIR